MNKPHFFAILFLTSVLGGCATLLGLPRGTATCPWEVNMVNHSTGEKKNFVVGASIPINKGGFTKCWTDRVEKGELRYNATYESVDLWCGLTTGNKIYTAGNVTREANGHIAYNVGLLKLVNTEGKHISSVNVKCSNM